MGLFDFASNLFDSFDFGWSDLFQIGGTAIGMYSDFKSGEDAEEVAKAQAKQNEEAAAFNKLLSYYDASVAEKQAFETFKSTQRDLQMHFVMADALLGKQQAGYSKSGAVVGTGSALNVAEETTQRLREDAAIILYNGNKAKERAEELADRYRMLGDQGLRDAAAQAILINEAANNEQVSYYYSAAGKGLHGLSEIFE